MTTYSDPHQHDAERPAPHGMGNEYPMLDIPFSAVIDGRRYRGEGVSLVGARVAGLVDPALDGSERVVRLAFDFPGFQLVLAPSVRISHQSASEVDLTFTEPTGDHYAQLRQVLNDYISGDLTSSGALIRSSDLTASGAKQAGERRRGFGAILRRILGSLMILCLAALLVALAGWLVDRRVFTTEITTPARIVPDGQTLRATADGQISFVDLQAGEGDVLYAIDTSDGETLTIGMPCDCTPRPINAAPGDTVLAGDPVVAVSAEDAARVIRAEVPRALVYDIERAGGVHAELTDGRTVTAHLAEGAHIRAGGAPDDYVTLTFVPDSPLGADATGRLARLTVRQNPFAPAWRRLRDGWGTFSDQIS